MGIDRVKPLSSITQVYNAHRQDKDGDQLKQLSESSTNKNGRKAVKVRV